MSIELFSAIPLVAVGLGHGIQRVVGGALSKREDAEANEKAFIAETHVRALEQYRKAGAQDYHVGLQAPKTIGLEDLDAARLEGFNEAKREAEAAQAEDAFFTEVTDLSRTAALEQVRQSKKSKS